MSTARGCCCAQRILDGEAAADEAQFLEQQHDEAGSSFVSAASLEEEFEAVKAEKAASLSSLFEDEDLVEVDAGVQDESLLVRALPSWALITHFMYGNIGLSSVLTAENEVELVQG